MHRPLISIVTVVYNDQDEIEDTIKSVVDQDYENKEYIIVDGGSTDDTLKIIGRYRDQITKVISERDGGIYDAMNKGLELANGEYINFMNSGDRYYENSVLSKLLVGFNTGLIVFGKSLTQFNNLSILRYDSFDKNDSEWYKKRMPNHQSVFVPINIYKTLSFDTNMKIFADTVFLRRAFEISDSFEANMIINTFSLGGISSYGPRLKDLRAILKDEIGLNGWTIQVLNHLVKFVLQNVMGRDRYLKFYINYIVKQ